MIKRLIASIVCLTFSFSNLQYVHAQDFSINQLPVPGTMVGESASFIPLALKGLIVNPQKPLEFQFIVDTGSDVSLRQSSTVIPAKAGIQNQEQLKQKANQLVKYFLAGLTIPEGDLWVNLSPYEKNRMVPEALGQTNLGRDLLAQDYILKQLTASLIYPEKDLGKEFWSRVYAKAQAQFGTTNVPVNTFNKVWILPDQAQVFENHNAAYVTKSTLKVMLDEDYLALQKHNSYKNLSFPNVFIGNPDTAHSIASQIVREIVIPEITKEVNTGKNFAPLRQIYQSLILAKWYKETIQNGLLDAVYTNKNKVAGVNLADPAVKEQIYERYLKAYKKGVFNYIKEDPTGGVIARSVSDEAISTRTTIPRKYFSGGLIWTMQLDHTGSQADIKGPDGAMVSLTVVLVAAAGVAAVVVGALKSGPQGKNDNSTGSNFTMLDQKPPKQTPNKDAAMLTKEEVIRLVADGLNTGTDGMEYVLSGLANDLIDEMWTGRRMSIPARDKMNYILYARYSPYYATAAVIKYFGPKEVPFVQTQEDLRITYNTLPAQFDAWKEIFNRYLEIRHFIYGEDYQQFTDEDYKEFFNGHTPEDGINAFLKSRGIYLPASGKLKTAREALISEAQDLVDFLGDKNHQQDGDVGAPPFSLEDARNSLVPVIHAVGSPAPESFYNAADVWRLYMKIMIDAHRYHVVPIVITNGRGRGYRRLIINTFRLIEEKRKGLMGEALVRFNRVVGKFEHDFADDLKASQWNVPLNLSQEEILMAQLMRDYNAANPEPKDIPVSGPESLNEAKIIKFLFELNGVPEQVHGNQVFFLEERSTNTKENMIKGRPFIIEAISKSYGDSGNMHVKIHIIADAFHRLRAMLLAKRDLITEQEGPLWQINGDATYIPDFRSMNDEWLLAYLLQMIGGPDQPNPPFGEIGRLTQLYQGETIRLLEGIRPNSPTYKEYEAWVSKIDNLRRVLLKNYEGALSPAMLTPTTLKQTPDAAMLATALRDTKIAGQNLLADIQSGNTFSEEGKKILHVVLGGEASDLDSIVSSIAYAYAMNNGPQRTQNILYVPLINIPRAKFRIRADAVYWLNRLGITEDDLLFTDTFDIVQGLNGSTPDALRSRNYDVEITLMDHYDLASYQKSLWPFVSKIIDHHIEKGNPEWKQQTRLQQKGAVKIDASFGSNTTMVAMDIERIFNGHIPSEIAQLLLGPIIKDTINLQDAKRTSEMDRKMAGNLLSITGIDQNKEFDALVKAAFDISKLSLLDLLDSDYKGYEMGKHTIGIASIKGGSMVKLNAKGNLQEAITQFLSDLETSGKPVPNVLFGMNIDLVDNITPRELFIYSPDIRLLSRLVEFLKENDSTREDPIELEDLDINNPHLISFKTSEKISRKILEPYLQTFFEEIDRAMLQIPAPKQTPDAAMAIEGARMSREEIRKILINTFDDKEFEAYWPGIVALRKAAKYKFHYRNGSSKMMSNADDLCKVGLPVVKNMFGKEEFARYWPKLIELGIAAGKDSVDLFKNGLPSLGEFIRNVNDLERIGFFLINSIKKQKALNVKEEQGLSPDELRRYKLSKKRILLPHRKEIQDNVIVYEMAQTLVHGGIDYYDNLPYSFVGSIEKDLKNLGIEASSYMVEIHDPTDVYEHLQHGPDTIRTLYLKVPRRYETVVDKYFEEERNIVAQFSNTVTRSKILEDKIYLGVRHLGIGERNSLTGNKEAGFLILEKLGLPYPPGIGISEQLVKDILESSPDESQEYIRLLNEQFKNTGIDIAKASFSVRSNPKRSMPGILKTVTDTRELLPAIREVAQSWDSEQARAFRRKEKMGDAYDLPIIIQLWVSGYKEAGYEAKRAANPSLPFYASGVFSTRNPNTNEKILFGQYLENVKGEELMTGGRNGKNINKLAKAAPEIYHQILEAVDKLASDKEVGPQEVEFVVNDGKLYFLQTRKINFAPQAEIAYLKEQLAIGDISEDRAIPQLEILQNKLSSRKLYKVKEGIKTKVLAQGVDSTPGAIKGYLVWNIDNARKLMSENKPVIFIAHEGNQEQVLSLIFDYPHSGLITNYGNNSSHEAVLTRLSGISSLINLNAAEWKLTGEGQGVVLKDGQKLEEESLVVIDGDKNVLFISDGDVLEENGVMNDASYGIDIPAYRKIFLAPYLNDDGSIKSEFTVEKLEELNQVAVEKFKEFEAGVDKKAAFISNLEKHLLHELLIQAQDSVMLQEFQRLSNDKAALTKDFGGIDLNQINVKRNGKTVNIQFDPAQLNALEQGGFEGFTPIIISIQHISSPFQLLGIGPAKEEEILAKV